MKARQKLKLVQMKNKNKQKDDNNDKGGDKICIIKGIKKTATAPTTNYIRDFYNL